MSEWKEVYYGVSNQDCWAYADREKARGSIGIAYKVEENGTENRPWVLYFMFEEIQKLGSKEVSPQ